MLPSSLPVALFWLYVGGSLGGSVLGTLATSRYDVRQARRLRQQRKHPYTKALRKRPHISIIVVTQDDEARIEACLCSIWISGYRKYDITVIDIGSCDNTHKIVEALQAKYPKRQLRLIKQKDRQFTKESLLKATSRRKRSEIVLPLTADCRLERHALRAICQLFAAHPATQTLLTRHYTEPFPSIYNLTARVADVLRSKAYKQGLGLLPANDLSLDFVYRRDYLERSLRADNMNDRSAWPVYAEEVIITEQPSSSRRKRRNFMAPLPVWQLPLRVLEPVALVFTIQLAVLFQNPLPLTIVGALIGLDLLNAVWSDRYVSVGQKLRLTSLLPMLLLIFGSLRAVQLLRFFSRRRSLHTVMTS